MNKLEITTVIPTYKRPRLLVRAIASVQAQNYEHLRICVYDNASGDETEEVVAGLMKEDPRISYLKRETNIGAMNNMCDASMRVTTPLYSMLNDDDFLLPGFHEAATKAFESSPEVSIAFAKTVIVDVEKMRWRLLSPAWEVGFYEPSLENATKMQSRRTFTRI